jgi:hypothetical protein
MQEIEHDLVARRCIGRQRQSVAGLWLEVYGHVLRSRIKALEKSDIISPFAVTAAEAIVKLPDNEL